MSTLSHVTPFSAQCLSQSLPKCADGPCRMDLSAPLAIFCSLFVAAIAFCGAVEARSPVMVEEVKVEGAENSIGPVDMDYVTSCGKNARRGGSAHERCHDPSFLRASVIH